MSAKPSRAASAAYGTYTGQGSASYVASAQVAQIVNLAIHLRRPLLVEGEAGCGKTRLAHAIAEELGLKDQQLVATTVKSTSQARDLLYRFDALRRLQDAQVKGQRDAKWVWPYIALQPLGHAIAEGLPALVLIDEIDKADIDFPNDLLDVLDRFQFEIEDLPASESAACKKGKGFGRLVEGPAGGLRPIVVITSNREKQLPEPFLRRCLYVELQFPSDPKMLEDIVRRNLVVSGESVGAELVERAVAQFLVLRERSKGASLQKPPATSELVDWVRALNWRRSQPDKVSADALDAADQAILFKVQKDLERWKGAKAGV